MLSVTRRYGSEAMKGPVVRRPGTGRQAFLPGPRPSEGTFVPFPMVGFWGGVWSASSPETDLKPTTWATAPLPHAYQPVPTNRRAMDTRRRPAALRLGVLFSVTAALWMMSLDRRSAAAP